MFNIPSNPTFSLDNRGRYIFSYSIGNNLPDEGCGLWVTFRMSYATEELHAEPSVTIWKDGSEYKLYTDDELKEAVQTYEDHEGHEPDTSWFNDKLDHHGLRMYGWTAEYSAKDLIADAILRWNAIRLIVNPHVTL